MINEEISITETKDTDNRIFVSEDDIYLNYDKWITGKSHVLLVNGLSASGKSTLAKKIAAKDDALYCELDILTFSIVGAEREARGNCTMEHIQSRNPLLAKWMKETHKDPRMFADIKCDPITFTHPPEDEARKQRAVDEFLEWICFKQEKKCVIEGGHLGITIANNPDKYRDFPMIFKGTSLSKSIIRRIRRNGKSPKWFLTCFFMLYSQYSKMFPEVNATRMAMLKNRDPDEIIKVKEDTSLIEEDGWKASIKNFNQFCQQIKKPNDVMKWFKKNKVQWNKHGNDEPFHWPDDLIREKTGNCFDQTLFMHYFCRKKRLENRIFLISWQSRVTGASTGHAVPVYRQGKYVYTFIYLSKGNGVIGGPFEDFTEAQEVLNKFFQVYVNKMFKTPVYVYSSYLDENDTKRFDQYYGNKEITQTDYITMNHGANMRSSHLYKMNLKGFSFWNPILPVFDLLDFAIRMLSKNGKGVKMDYENFFESSQIDYYNEGTIGYYDKYGNYKIRVDSMYLDCDSNADEDYYKRKIEYIYLKDTKYSAKPQPVIWYGDHDYRARCEVIVLKGNQVLLDRSKNRGGSGYSLPGGGIDTKETFAQGATRECEEEAMIIPKNVKYMDICWREEFPKPKVYNDGAISFVCVATFGGSYHGRVVGEDKDEFADRAVWEDYKTANLIEPHRLAIERYLGRSIFKESVITEDKLKADERTDFGIPSKKKYPMPDEQHVRSAIQYFNKCDPEDEAILAKNILKYMKKYKMKPVNVSKDNKFYKYYHPKNTNESYLEEGYYKSKYEQCKMVYDSLSDEEKKYMGGHFIDSPAVVYRKIAQNKETKQTIGYVELVDAEKLGKAPYTVFINVAVHPHFRGQDLGTALIKDAVHWFKGTEYRIMKYVTHIDNIGSRRLAEKCGFVFFDQDNRKHTVTHAITNPNRLKAIGEEMEQMLKEMSGGSGIVGMEINDVSVQTSSPGMFIIGYGERDNFVGDGGDNSGYAIANDIFTKHIFRRKNGKTVKENFSFLNDRQITIYEYKGEPIRFYLLLKEAELGIVDENTDDMTYFYEALSGNTMICEDQIDYDDKFACWNTVRELANLRTSEITMEEEFNKLIGKENYSFPVISNEDLELENDLRKLKDSYRLYEDIKGYYVFDEDTNLRTVSMDKKMIQAMTI